MVTRSGARWDGPGHGNDMARRRQARPWSEDGARGREQRGRAKRRQQELTGRPMRWSASSGASSVLRIERRRSPAVAMKMAVMAWLQGTRRRMRRGRASWGRDGAQGCEEGARGWLWPRRTALVATGSARRVHGGRQRRKRGSGEETGGAGGEGKCVASPEGSGRKQEVARAGWR